MKIILYLLGATGLSALAYYAYTLYIKPSQATTGPNIPANNYSAPAAITDALQPAVKVIRPIALMSAAPDAYTLPVQVTSVNTGTSGNILSTASVSSGTTPISNVNASQAAATNTGDGTSYPNTAHVVMNVSPIGRVTTPPTIAQSAVKRIVL